MSRRARIVIPDVPHHVTQRGNYQQNVFEEESDYRRYAILYADHAHKYGVKTLSYCLMANHVHFIVVPRTEDGLSRLFNSIHMQYSQFINKKNNKKGHLWQGRFYSCVLSPEHLYRAIRYVEQNPVRAKIVTASWDYPWSSAKQHVGNCENAIIPTVAPDQMMEGCGWKGGDNWKAYLEEEDSCGHDKIRQETRNGYILGSKEFVNTIIAKKVGKV